MSSASKTWILRARHAGLVLVLLACSLRLESSGSVQSSSLTVLFSPSAGTFVGSETVQYRPGGFHYFKAGLDGEGRMVAFRDYVASTASVVPANEAVPARALPFERLRARVA